MKKTLILFLLIFLPFFGSAQQVQFRIDSLKRELAKATHDTTRLSLYRSLSGSFAGFNIDSSIWYAEKFVALARQTKDRESELWGLYLLATSLFESDIPKSMALYLRVIKESQHPDLMNTYRVGVCHHRIGALYMFLENFRLAIHHYRLAIPLLEKSQKKIALVRTATTPVYFCLTELGGAFLYNNQLDSARYYLTKAAKINPGIIESQGYLQYSAGTEIERNPKLALHLFQKSFRVARQSGSLRALSLISRRFSEFYLHHTAQLDSAISISKTGIQAAKGMNYIRGIYINSRVLSQIYKRQRNIDSAYRYQNLMLDARDSLFSQDKINQIQITVIEEQQRVQQLEEEKLKLENRTKVYASLGTMVVLLAFVLVFYRNQRKTQKANALLQRQRDEIHQQRTQLQQSLATLQSTQAQLIQKEKLASLGELTAGIAHEIQNPLNFVNNFSEVSTELVSELEEEQQKPAPDTQLATELLGDLKQNLQKITHHGQRASSIVKGMLEHSRGTTGERQLTDINQLADEYLRLSYHGLRAKDSNFNSDYELIFDDNLPLINVVPQEIGRVLLNLINNAFYAVHQRAKKEEIGYQPKVTVRTEQKDTQVQFSIQDNGPGISPAVLSKVFQPFFTTKPTGEGTGLGLSLSYDIVTKGYNGTLKVESIKGEGAAFIIQLPFNS